MCDDIPNCCRICLGRGSDHVLVLEDPTIILHLKSCLSVTVSPNDHLPKSICGTCVSLLNQFYNFQLNARCSQDWLESSVQEKSKKSSENKMLVQPLPDSEYNSDSLLEFLNNTANIEEYLNNLGKEDIPCIVNMLDRNEQNIESSKIIKTSPKKKDTPKKIKLGENFDCDFQIVKGLLKDLDAKVKPNQQKTLKNTTVCYACKTKFDSVQKLLQHMSICETASRTCAHCNELFDSKQQMQQHSITHNIATLTCYCGEQFPTKERLLQHYKSCHTDYAATLGCVYRCKECRDTFTERFQLYKHAKEHVLKSQMVCDICADKFSCNEALTKHRKSAHDNPKNVKYRCKICSHTSDDHKEMYLHVKKHTTIPSKPEPIRHLCELCGRSFATNSSLHRHTQTHGTNIGNHSTNIGNKQLGQGKELAKCIVNQSEMSVCEKCGQCFNSIKLNLHTCV